MEKIDFTRKVEWLIIISIVFGCLAFIFSWSSFLLPCCKIPLSSFGGGFMAMVFLYLSSIFLLIYGGFRKQYIAVVVSFGSMLYLPLYYWIIFLTDTVFLQILFKIFISVIPFIYIATFIYSLIKREYRIAQSMFFIFAYYKITPLLIRIWFYLT